MLLESAGKTRYLWVRGPGKISVDKGAVMINGANYIENEEAIIHKDRSYIMKLKPKSRVNINTPIPQLMREALKEEVNILEEWEEKTSIIVNECINKTCTVTIIGSIDSGKTSFTTMLANKSLEEKINVYYLDADIGQSTIGLSGFISITKYKSKSVWPREFIGKEFHYIGKTSPQKVITEVIHGVSKLLASIKEKSMRIIDTDGWFTDYKAIDYKRKLITEASTTHAVVLVEKGWEYYVKAIKKTLPKNTRVLKLRAPPHKTCRTRRERTVLRTEKINRYINASENRVIPIKNLYFTGNIIFGYGEPLSNKELLEIQRITGKKIIHGEKLNGKQILITNTYGEETGLKHVIEYNIQLILKRIVGLIDNNGKQVGPGVIIGYNEKPPRIIIKTIHKGPVSGVIVGDIKI